MNGAGTKRCLVAFATPEREYLWTVTLQAADTIEAALRAARAQAGPAGAAVPWESAAVGIFGEVRRRSDACAHGDRIEIYRALKRDPRERRRERVARERRPRR
jgi:putative ubiquitin-RnfH superfamily antitoxin RatB of RatAB toxin-antitoxin module